MSHRSVVFGSLCRSLGVLVLTVVLSGCSSVRIHTGPTSETAAESSERQAGQIRASFYRQLQSASPAEKVNLLGGQIDSVSERYFEYGFDVAREWRFGNEGRGTAIPAAEMRGVVDGWISTQKPILRAWEDNIEEARRQIMESRFFPQAVHDVIDRFVDQYYSAFGVVFYPAGSVFDYENELHQARAETQRLSRALKEAIAGY